MNNLISGQADFNLLDNEFNEDKKLRNLWNALCINEHIIVEKFTNRELASELINNLWDFASWKYQQERYCMALLEEAIERLERL
ncbi:MAG: hypothetical protein AABY22_32625 [Nanoarchaeota archaeon]